MPASKMTAHVFTSARQQVSACSLRPAAAACRGRRLAGVGARQRQVTCSPAPCCPAPSDGAGTRESIGRSEGARLRVWWRAGSDFRGAVSWAVRTCSLHIWPTSGIWNYFFPNHYFIYIIMLVLTQRIYLEDAHENNQCFFFHSSTFTQYLWAYIQSEKLRSHSKVFSHIII